MLNGLLLLCMVGVNCECLLCSLCADDGCFDVPLIMDCLCLFAGGRDPSCWFVCGWFVGSVKSGGVVGISSC